MTMQESEREKREIREKDSGGEKIREREREETRE